ncbi:MAG: hypothetical protein JJU12_05730 [Chlamydiales bacterium]|nr:hypothetical protein [Chlamydiales bacterium]
MSEPIEGVGEKRSNPEYQKHSPKGLDSEQQHKIDAALAFHRDIMGFARQHDGGVSISQFDLMVHYLIQIQEDTHMPAEIREKASGLISTLKANSSQEGGMVFVDVAAGDAILRDLGPLSSQ